MNERLDVFTGRLKKLAPAFLRELERTRSAELETLQQLSAPMLAWAEAALGPIWADTLIEGYCEFVLDVNRAQLLYEKEKHYQNQSFAEVYARAYSNPEFMQLYHWGVYSSTFVWLHHLRIYKFFAQYFVPLLQHRPDGYLVDLGAGSGIWHLLALQHAPNWKVSAIDISQPSIDRSRQMASILPYAGQIEHVCDDATKWRPGKLAQAGISCFVMEHLEHPEELMAGLGACIEPGGHAFVTGALTAAEIDHIFEFKRESDVVLMCEQAGFRVKHLFSAAPEVTPPDRFYLPRSIALVLQKRKNEIW